MSERETLFDDFGFLARTYVQMNRLPYEAIKMFLGAGTREDNINLIRYWAAHLHKQADLISALEQEVDSIRRELGRE